MSRVALTFLALALLGLTCVWCLPGDATGEPALRWEGVVLGPDGEPVAGAQVSLRTPDASCLLTPGLSFLSTVTGPDGRFALEGPEGAMEVYVEHPRYAPTWRPGVESQMIPLRDASWLEVDVAEGAQIRVSHGLRRLATGEAGSTRLGPLPPDLALLVTIESDRARTEQYTVTLGEGETQAASPAMARGRGIRGRVVPARAGVMLCASQGEARQSRATTAADGTFELQGLREGRTRLVALLPEGGVSVIDCDAGDDDVRVEVSR